MGTAIQDKKHYVYRYMHGNDIIYIGRCSRYLQKRINAEEKVAESALINKYKPLLNVTDNEPSEYSNIEISIKADWQKWMPKIKEIDCKRNKLVKTYSEEAELNGYMWEAESCIKFVEYLDNINYEDDRKIIDDFPYCGGLPIGVYLDFYHPFTASCVIFSQFEKHDKEYKCGRVKLCNDLTIGNCKYLRYAYVYHATQLYNKVLQYKGYDPNYVSHHLLDDIFSRERNPLNVDIEEYKIKTIENADKCKFLKDIVLYREL